MKQKIYSLLGKSFMVLLLLNLTAPGAYALEINPKTPSNKTVCEDYVGDVSYYVEVKILKGYTYTYQWQIGYYDRKLGWVWTDMVNEKGKVAGATTNTLVLYFDKVQRPADFSRYSFRCEVTETYPLKRPVIGYSNQAYLYTKYKVNVTKNPSSATKNVGESVTFSISASGSDRKYQWDRSNDASTWTAISGATSYSYTITDIQAEDDDYYRCRVYNGSPCNSQDYSSAAKLTVNVPDWPDGWFGQEISTSKNLKASSFVSSLEGWIAAYDQSNAFHTIDGGDSWTSVPIGQNVYAENIQFVNSSTGWIGGSTRMAYTVNGGDDWTILSMYFTEWDPEQEGESPVLGYVKDFHFISTTTGWAVGSDGLIAKTTDGGQTWNLLNYGNQVTNYTDANLYSVYFTSSTVGYVCGVNGALLKTTNGGIDWVEQSVPYPENLYDVYFLNSNTGYAVGMRHYTGAPDYKNYTMILKTTDGGSNWNIADQDAPSIYILYSVYFTDANNGYTVGSQGNILKTVDGGQTWYQQSSGTSEYLNDVHMFDSDNGWIVGNAGTIIRTANSGCRKPVVNLYEDKEFCETESYTIRADTFSYNENVSYLWSTGSTNGHITVSDSNSYSVTITNLCGETAQDEVLIDFHPLPMVDAGEPVEVCLGDSVQLNASGGVDYLWNYPDYLNDHTLQNPLASPPSTRNFTVTVTDENGCSNQADVMVTVHPIPTSTFSSPAYVCGDGDAELQYTGTGGGGTSYFWDAGEANIVSGDTSSSSLQVDWSSLGMKDVSLFVEENNCVSDTTTRTISVNEIPTADFEVEKDAVCKGSSIEVTYTGTGTGAAVYDWNFDGGSATGSGAGPYDVSWSGGGVKTVSLDVTENNCTSPVFTRNVESVHPHEGLEICLVTIDEETGNNMVVWEPVADDRIENYMVYRQGIIAGQYDPIGMVHPDSLALFVDHEVDPSEQQYRYKVAVMDTCGNVSELSNYHETILLQYNGGLQDGIVNLRWDKYEIQGQEITFDTYVIYRGADSVNLEPVKSIAGTNTSWIDNTTGITDKKYWYRIAGQWEEMCYPDGSKLVGKKAGSGPYSYSLSNLEDNRASASTSLEEIMAERYMLSIYPNPFSEYLLVGYALDKTADVSVGIYNMLGSKVYTMEQDAQLAGSYQYRIRTSEYNMKDGIYYLQLTVDDKVITRKLVHQR